MATATRQSRREIAEAQESALDLAELVLQEPQSLGCVEDFRLAETLLLCNTDRSMSTVILM